MNVIGFDDGPFSSDHRGDVLLVGVVCSGTRVDGVISGKVRRDGTGRDLGYPGGHHRPPRFDEEWLARRAEAADRTEPSGR